MLNGRLINGQPENKVIGKSDLTPSIYRNMKRKALFLSLTCQKLWIHTNKLNETYIFGRFGKKKDKTDVIVTLGYYHMGIHKFIHVD